jgi:hypothetical protein
LSNTESFKISTFLFSKNYSVYLYRVVLYKLIFVLHNDALILLKRYKNSL